MFTEIFFLHLKFLPLQKVREAETFPHFNFQKYEIVKTMCVVLLKRLLQEFNWILCK